MAGQLAPVPLAKLYLLPLGKASYVLVSGSFLSARLIIPKLVFALLPLYRFV